MELGNKIRRLRQQCNLTQEELADRCELTKGYISQLENDLTSPSIATLKDILSALGSSLKDFFSEEEQEKVVYNDEDFIEKNTGDIITNWLIPNAQKNIMEPIKLSLAPGSKTDNDVAHEGEEFGYILEGEIHIVLGKKKYLCKKGSSFYYKADKSHRLENNGKELATLIWVSSPPTF